MVTREMRILIKHRPTGLFFKAANEWIPNPEEARVFTSALEAFHFSQMNALKDTEMVFQQRTSQIQKILSQPIIPKTA